MADWSLMHRDWAGYYHPYQYQGYPLYHHQQGMPVPQNAPPPQAQPYSIHQHSPALALLLNPPRPQPPPAPAALPQASGSVEQAPKVESPRELRNKAEKQRRDKLNQSIAELASMVPPVVASSKKIDKTGVLRLTAHYLRAHQYVFCNEMVRSNSDFNPEFTNAVLKLFNGFLITTTYRGIIVVVSQNVHQYLGFAELDLLGQNLLTLTHPKDRQLLLEQLQPKSQTLGPNGELLIPNEPDGVDKVNEGLRRERRSFVIRLKKQGPRSEPPKYVSCHVDGSFRKADGANHTLSRCCQVVRRSRTRGEPPVSSGNDIVFIGIVRPATDTFQSESELEMFSMEYRTRHSVDGLIMQCEQRISLVTGYMTQEVRGINAMNFIYRDDVLWVASALRDMFYHHRLYGESCYRLITKTGHLVFMRTRGYIDMDKDTKSVTTFVCTNTIVSEAEGKRLMKIMKKKVAATAKAYKALLKREEASTSQAPPVEHPKQVFNIVKHMLSDLPATSPSTSFKNKNVELPSPNIVIIPPKTERIASGVEKIYTVFKNMNNEPVDTMEQAPTGSANEVPNDILDIDIQPLFATENSASVQEINESNTVQPLDMPSTSTAAAACKVQPNYLEPEPVNITTNNATVSEAVAVQNPVDGFVIPEITFDTYFSENDTDLDLDSFLCPDTMDESQIKYQLIMENQIAKSGSRQTGNYLTVPSFADMNQLSLKRPGDFAEQASSSKKKVPEPTDAFDNDFSCLESLFDDDSLNIQIETAIMSLDQTIEPGFPELLVPSEVQEILGELEEEHRAEMHKLLKK